MDDGDEVKLYPLVYSAPRRFDLATVLAVTIAYALLFTLMRLVNFPPIVFIWFAGLFTVVAAFQALLFGGNRPRAASVVGGVVYMLITLVTMVVFDRLGGGYVPDLCFLLTIVFFGPLVSYLAGALVGGVFLVAEKIRHVLDRKGNRPTGSGGNSPWDEPEE